MCAQAAAAATLADTDFPSIFDAVANATAAIFTIHKHFYFFSDQKFKSNAESFGVPL